MSFDLTKYLSFGEKKHIEGNHKIYGGNNIDKNIILSKLNATPFVDIILGILEKKNNNETHPYIINREKKLQELIQQKRSDISKKIVNILIETLPSGSKDTLERFMTSTIDDNLIKNKLEFDIQNLLSGPEIQAEISKIKELSSSKPNTFLIDYYNTFIEPHNPSKASGRYSITHLLQELGGIAAYSDNAIVCGSAEIAQNRFGIIGHNKQNKGGRATTQDHLEAIKYIKQYEKENLPIVFWIDTPGSDSGKNANDTHQAKVMSELITTVGDLKVPSMGILAGEGGSGGAQVFMGADKIYAVNDSYFSTIHPKGQEGILRGKYSAKELAWIQKMDVYHLFEKGVIDDIIDINPVKNERNTQKIFTRSISNLVSKHFYFSGDSLKEYSAALKASRNKNIQKLIKTLKTEKEIQNFIRNDLKKAKLNRASSRMITPRTKENQEELNTQLNQAKQYEKSLIANDFKNIILSSEHIKEFHEKKLRVEIMDFFKSKFKDATFSKFNIKENIKLLGFSMKDIKISLQENNEVPQNGKNNIVGFLKQELSYMTTLFNIIGEIIDPKNYNKFFVKEAFEIKEGILKAWWEKMKNEKENKTKYLEYTEDQVDSLLTKIYENISIDDVDLPEKNWRESKFQWLEEILTDKDYAHWLKELLTAYKTAHYDLPETVNSMTCLLLEKFVQFIKNKEKYDSKLKESKNFTISYGDKARYENINLFDTIRKKCIGKITIDMVEDEFFSSFNPEYSYKREQVTPLEGKNGVFTPNSSVKVGFGRIKGLKRQKGIVMIDTSVDFGAIDGSATAAIINLIKETAIRNVSVVMFIQSSGMNVNAGPEAVSSMSAINKAISDFHEKTGGKKKVVIVPMGVTTGGTIASFAQAPGNIVIPLSLTDILFAGRIVTSDLLPLESTLADFQIKSDLKPYGIDAVIANPYIEGGEYAYKVMQKDGINIQAPIYTFDQYLVENGYFERSQEYQSPKPQAFRKVKESFQPNKELFRPFQKVAIHNRGVIANKAQKVFKKLGIEIIQLHTNSDAKQNYVENQNIDSVKLEDYVKDTTEIIKAVKDNGCDAIYLGYGFLSENADFIRQCERNKIVVIGPNSKNVFEMGDKLTARITSKKVLDKLKINREKYGPAKGSDDVFNELKKDTKEGYKIEGNWIQDKKGNKIVDKDGLLGSKESAVIVANKIGLPVMLKARFGGGGKGIKFIREEKDIIDNFDTLSSEAKASFGNPDMYLEKAMENQMHIEVQVFADIDGNVVTMGLRNCSIQRRGQKVIEECGKMNIDTSIIRELEKFVRGTAKEIGYVGAGTFEFLYDPEKKKFTFMEMNTRIQVEHTITEEHMKNAGIKIKKMKELNLVELQTKLAMGKTGILPKQQEIDKAFDGGYTLEARICAEDPVNNFTGVQMAKIKNIVLDTKKPKGIESVRFESFLKLGENTGGNTGRGDSMIGQLIVSGKNREMATKYLRILLKKMKIEGIPTNKDYVANIMKDDKYKRGDFRITDVDKDMEGKRKFLKGLKKFDGEIESVIDSDENFVELQPGEYVVRTKEDFTFYKKPSPDKEPYIKDGQEVTIDEKTTIYTKEVSKSFSQVTKLEGVYIKDYKRKEIPLSELGKIKVTSVVANDGAKVSNGNALFIIKKA